MESSKNTTDCAGVSADHPHEQVSDSTEPGSGRSEPISNSDHFPASPPRNGLRSSSADEQSDAKLRPVAQRTARDAGASAIRRRRPHGLWRMRLYLRAVAYFRQDLPLIGLLLLAIGFSTTVGLLVAWPMALLIDSVLSTPTKHTFIHRLFLSPLPDSTLGKIVGLALIGLGLKLTQDLLSVLQTILTNTINYNGLMRVRCDLYRKLQV